MPSPGGWIASFLPFVGQRRGFVRQSALAVIADVKLGHEEALGQELDRIGHDLRSNQQILFHNMHTVHYAAWLILPGIKGESAKTDGPARLVLETNYDGTLEDQLNDLIDRCGLALDQIYAHCEGYPGGASDKPGRDALTPHFYH